MATVADSYSRVVNPINASSGGRPGGDTIAVSFAHGKKSTKEQLEELAIKKAQDDLARLSLVPVGSEQQKYQWAAEEMRMKQEEDVRKATQAALANQQTELALQQSKLTNPLDVISQIESIDSARLAQQGSQLAQKEQRLMLPGQLEAQRLSAQQTQQSIAQAALMNPLSVKSAQMQVAQSRLTNPLDVKAKQVGIQGAQQQIQTAAQDELYRQQAYRDAHWGMTPSQINALQASSGFSTRNSSITAGITDLQKAYDTAVRYGAPGPKTQTYSANPAYGKSPWR